MIKIVVFDFLLLGITSYIHAAEFDSCRDVVVDQVTNIAYGQQGAPYTGEVVCYSDENKTIPKYKKEYSKGVAVGEHVCYDEGGSPFWSIGYEEGKAISYWTANIYGEDEWEPMPCVRDIKIICERRDFSSCGLIKTFKYNKSPKPTQ